LAPGGEARPRLGKKVRDMTFEAERRRMVETQIEARGVREPRVLRAMENVPRHLFVPEGLRGRAYGDEPLPIGEGQTISQPYIVAYMTEALRLRGGEKVLEVGTGSGYQTAVLAGLAAEVYTIELIESLSLKAREALDRLGYGNIWFRVGDGSLGWPPAAPFGAIIVTAAAAKVPAALEDQLGMEGTMIVPVGTDLQELMLVRREKKGLRRERLLPVRFVPLVVPH
jgi:protein-L-isoaspartate(D-aspartate) O-methyltransferase